MDPVLLSRLTSPVTRRPLALADGTLRTADGEEEFALLDGIPILLPPGQITDWCCEALEVIFGPQTADLVAEVHAAETPEAGDEVIRAAVTRLGKREVRERFQGYGERPLSERLGTCLRPRSHPHAAEPAVVPQAALDAARQYASLEAGRERARQAAVWEQSWAHHLDAYGAAVLAGNPDTIVELGTGAGLGTWALLRRGLGSGVIVPLDVDFACAGSAMGLAQALGLQYQVSPVVASFWFLPFRDGSIDAVCAHYGLDESREVPRVLEDVSRILVSGGKFVNVSRLHPADRLNMVLGFLDFGDDELLAMAAQARLCAGPEQLVADADTAGLPLERQEAYLHMPGRPHVLLVFRKP